MPLQIALLIVLIIILAGYIFRSDIALLLNSKRLKSNRICQGLLRYGTRAQTVTDSGGHSLQIDLDKLNKQMVRIDGGCFQMGDPFREGVANEYPLHEVWLSDYYLSSFLVTQDLWTRIMGFNRSRFTSDGLLPVENASYDEVLEFIDRLNRFSGQMFRLPSEAEWEFAARERGKDVRFGNGQSLADPTQINFNAEITFPRNYSTSGTFLKQTSPVGSFEPNALGLYDMSGNLFEWTRDFYDETAYQRHAILDPVNTKENSFVVARGGSWNNHAARIRCSCRSYFKPTVRNSLIGFRLAKSAKPT